MPTSPTPIDAAPTTPDRADRATFPARMYAFFVHLAGAFTSGVNAIADNTYDNAVEAATSATTANTKAGEAAASASTAATQAGIATTQAGIATTAADEAFASASTAATQATTATTQAGIATTKAAEAAASAASIAGGPVASVNGNTGIVTLAAADVGAQAAMTTASQAEMEAGTEAALRAMSPLRVAQAIAALASGGISTAASIATSTTLTNASAGYQRIAMTTMGQSVTLPDATTLAIGAPKFYLDNSAGGYPVGIRNSAGTLLMAIAAGGTAYANCEDISTAAGVWAITGTNLEPGLITIDNTFSSTYASTVLRPFVALDDNKSIHFLLNAATTALYAVAVDKTTGAVGTPVLVVSSAGPRVCTAFKITATTAVAFYDTDSSSGNLTGVVISLSGATSLAVGTASSTLTVADAGREDFSGAPKIAQLDATHYLVSYATATGAGTTSVVAFEITSGTTCTLGTPANIIAANNVLASTTTYALTATTGLVTYLENAASPYTQKVVVISVSGTTCTVGTPAAGTVNVNVNTSPKQSCLLSPTKVLIQDEAAAANPTNYYVTPYTISGTTVTAGTRFAVEIGLSAMGTSGYTDSSATRYNPHLFPLSASTALLWYLDSSGVSRAVVLSESGGTVTKGTKLYRSISAAAADASGFGAIMPQGTTEFVSLRSQRVNTSGFGHILVPCKISGTTISQGAGVTLPDVSQASPVSHVTMRLSGGDYVVVPYAGGVGIGSSGLPVFKSNGDFISNKGTISVPGLYFISSSNVPSAVSSNRIVVVGVTTSGTTVGASTYQLRLLSVEIAA